MRKIWIRQKKNSVGYVFVIPIIIGLFVIYIPSLVRAVIISLSELTFGADGIVMEFAGILHYNYAFVIDPNFTTLVVNSLRDLLINVPTITIFAFFMAVVLNQSFLGRATFRTIFFLPVIISTGVLHLAGQADVIQNMYTAGTGLDIGGVSDDSFFNYQYLRQILRNSDLPPLFIELTLGTIDRIGIILMSSGVQILLFLAALQSISQSHYEVAKIEGASSWEILWKISFPLVSPIILVVVLFSIIETFYNFTNPIVNIINDNLRNPNQMAYGSALALIYFVVIAAVIAVLWWFINKFVIYLD